MFSKGHPDHEWAAPVVVVPKCDGGLHLCGDYKVTVNPALDVEQYAILELHMTSDVWGVVSSNCIDMVLLNSLSKPRQYINSSLANQTPYFSEEGERGSGNTAYRK